jgi:hypothetical protein
VGADQSENQSHRPQDGFDLRDHIRVGMQVHSIICCREKDFALGVLERMNNLKMI